MALKNKLLKELADWRDFFGYSGISGALPNPDKILGSSGKTYETLRNLKNDPHVWSCAQSRKSGVLAFDYSIDPGESDRRIAEEVERIFADLDMNRFFREILEAPLFGFQPIEIMWRRAGGGRFLYPEDLIGKPQEMFFFDSRGELRYKKSGLPGGVVPPPGKMLNPRFEASYMNPYGGPLLSKCFWPVTFKNAGLKFWVNFTEKYGMPLLLGRYERGATFDETQKLADDLANMTEDAVIVSPSDIQIELKEASRGASSELYRDMISHCNAEISKALLSQTLTTEIDMGSYAAAQTHFKVRKEVVLADARLVERCANELIGIIVETNFPRAAAPKFRFEINDSENSARIDRDAKLAAAGFRFTKKYWIRTYGFKEDEIAE